MRPVPDQADQSRQTFNALSRLFERIAGWLVEVGTWVLTGLIALNLVIIAALITVGPVDTAVRVAVAAFGCALPLEVAGMILLRLSKDVEDIQLEDKALQAFEEAHFPQIRAYFPAERQRGSVRKRRARITLGYALVIGAISLALTLTGIMAALWHMAPWIAEASLAMAFLSAILILVVVAHSMPPESKAERELRGHSEGPK
jgi:hypothetical protein